MVAACGRIDFAAVTGGVGSAGGDASGAPDGVVVPGDAFRAMTIAVGLEPQGIVVADFDRDSKLDLAIALQGANAVVVLAGDGAGGFGAPAMYAVGMQPVGVATADFNKDGYPDLAVTDSASNDVAILLGGAGGFGAAVTHPTGMRPMAVIAIDLDGDGNIDIATADNLSSQVSVFGGNGNGGFGPAKKYSVDSDPNGVTAHDLDGDGRPDLVATSWGTDHADVLINGGNTFATSVPYSAGSRPWGITTGDFDGNGTADLAIADQSNSGHPGPTLLLNTGNGVMGMWKTYDSTAHSLAITVGHFDADAKLDCAVASYGGAVADVFFGDGAGGLGSRVTIAVGTAPAGIVTADLDGDGFDDLVVTNDGTGDITILRGPFR